MSIVEECPSCGNYTTTPDGRLDVFVVYELCERCRNSPVIEETQRAAPIKSSRPGRLLSNGKERAMG